MVIAIFSAETSASEAADRAAVSGRNFIRCPTTLKGKVQYFKELVFAYMVDKIFNDQVSASSDLLVTNSVNLNECLKLLPKFLSIFKMG